MQQYLVGVTTSWTLLIFLVTDTVDGLAVVAMPPGLVDVALVATLLLWKDVVFLSVVVLLLFRAVVAVVVILLPC